MHKQLTERTRQTAVMNSNSPLVAANDGPLRMIIVPDPSGQLWADGRAISNAGCNKILHKLLGCVGCGGEHKRAFVAHALEVGAECCKQSLALRAVYNVYGDGAVVGADIAEVA